VQVTGPRALDGDRCERAGPVSPARAEDLLESWNEREAPYYELYVRAVRFDSLPRSGWTIESIFQQMRSVPLPQDCERVLYFASAGLSEFLWETAALLLPVPVVRGSVGGRYGFVYANVRTPVGLLFELSYVRSLRSVLVHELYHFWGCPHALRMRRCYRDIQRTKGIEPGRGRERELTPGS
jgi:hypothetical protein